MKEVYPNLWIGNSFDAKNISVLKEIGIKSVLNVAFDLNDTLPHDINQVKIGLIDGPGNIIKLFTMAVLALENLLSLGPVLIHCHEGISRSVAVAAAYVCNKTEYPLERILDQFKAVRPQISPKPAMLGLAQAFLDGVEQ